MIGQETEIDPAQLFASVASCPSVLIAVSGGPDSMALLRFAVEWRDSLQAPPSLTAATVDHGLRLASHVEAEQVAEWSQALGVSHKTLIWKGEKPLTGIQERARNARYELLFEHMREIGASAVMTAHHADDQWETVMMRMARGTGIPGLAAMSRDQILPGGRLFRPLLGVPKAALIAHCRDCGQEFFDDPSNIDQKFERARWRDLAKPLHQLGFTRDRAVKLSDRAAKYSNALDWAAARFFDEVKISTEVDGYDFSSAEIVPQAVIEHFLKFAIAKVAGAPPSRLDRLETLAGALTRARGQKSTLRTTLGGCDVALDKHGKLKIHLEGARKRGVMKN